jgi:protein-disulfide isomerase
MKSAYVLLAAAALMLPSAACNAEKGTDSTANSSATPIKPIAPPAGGDWTKMVANTPQGGVLMGNPNADVKIVEYGSLTCPHCAEFAEKGAPKLIDTYVKTGRVSYEFRNFLRDGLDMALSLVAHCAGPEKFFPLSDAMFRSQREFFERAQAATPEQQQALQASPSPQLFADLAGVQQWAAQRGVPSARSSACLANQNLQNPLMQTSSDATTQFPEFSGTPTFILNGEQLKQTATWDKLEPAIRDALGS